VVRDIYRGFTSLYPRSTILLTTYFLFVDTMRRKTSLWSYKAGQFFISGMGAVAGFWLVWPLEVLKNMA